QVLFPNEFLPALDLLDRKLVTRFRIGIEQPVPTTSNNATTAALDVQMQDSKVPLADNTPDNSDTVHYVRSVQQRSSRFSTSYDSTTSYEVRLRAWNCTCPAFAFAAFPSVHPEPPKRKTLEWMFGGVSLGEGMPPVCKHLLACVLAERCRCVFGECVEERRVDVETAAGWAAGWG
ncbi:hypothetical protein BU25DRAFT_323426, partial [Macroventuria anomochaeta]